MPSFYVGTGSSCLHGRYFLDFPSHLLNIRFPNFFRSLSDSKYILWSVPALRKFHFNNNKSLIRCRWHRLQIHIKYKAFLPQTLPAHLDWEACIKAGNGNCYLFPGLQLGRTDCFYFLFFLSLLILDLAYGVMVVKTQLDECLVVWLFLLWVWWQGRASGSHPPFS